MASGIVHKGEEGSGRIIRVDISEGFIVTLHCMDVRGCQVRVDFGQVVGGVNHGFCGKGRCKCVNCLGYVMSVRRTLCMRVLTLLEVTGASGVTSWGGAADSDW